MVVTSTTLFFWQNNGRDMVWIFAIILVVMLAVYAYTVFWTAFSLNKKGQPLLDDVFQQKREKEAGKSN
jgi:hypothetical protein